MILADIEKPSTVIALVAGVLASLGCALVTLAVLLENWMEPACDPGMSPHLSYCDINGEDYSRALPLAAITLVVVLWTILLRRWVLSHQEATRGESRSARTQTRIVVVVSVMAFVSLALGVVYANFT